MPVFTPTEELTYVEPPVEETQPEAAAPPGPVTPVEELTFTEEPAPAAAAPEAPPPAGPVENAIRGVGDFLGGAVAPLMEQVPEPVQNLANSVGQLPGGIVDVATDVTSELGQGDIPGAVGAALGGLSAPWERGVEQVGERIMAGEPPVPQNEILGDPGQLLSILPGLASQFGPVPAVTGVTEEQWVRDNPAAAQTAYQQGGGVGLRDAYLSSVGASDVPPPQLSNPLDAATSGNPLERAAQVATNIPGFLGGYLTSGKQGTLGPFLLGTAQSIVEDPLTLLDLGVGEALAAPVRSATRNLVTRAPIIRDIPKLAPTEEARLLREQQTAAASELLTAQERQGVVPTPAEAPATAATPGSTVLPSSNGRQVPTPDLAQPAAAAPPSTGLTVEEVPVPGVGTVYRIRENGRMVAGMPTAEAADNFIRDRIAATPPPFSSAGPAPPGVGFPNYESVPLRPGAPLRERSALTGRPLIPEGSRPDLEGPLRAQLDSLGLSDIGIKLVNDLRDVSPSAGPLDQAVYRGKERLIGISLDAARLNELPRLIDHEAIHALSDLGLFQGREFDILVNAADRMDLREGIAAKYPDVTPERLNEELVAEVYTRFRAGDKIPAPVRNLLQRIGDFLLSFGRGLREGLPEDVLRRIESGEVGGRPRTGAGGVAGDALSRYGGPAYHGSDLNTLKSVSADPYIRNWSNAASEVGAWFTPDRTHAKWYANNTYETMFGDEAIGPQREGPGTVYRGEVNLNNAYDMTSDEFGLLDNETDNTYMGRELRERLIDEGYDGVIVWKRGTTPPDSGVVSPDTPGITAIASFDDVPVTAEDAFARKSRDAARAAYSTADEGYRARLEEGFAEGRDQMVNGVMVTKETKRLAEAPAIGTMKFRDGTRPTQRTFADEVFKQRGDFETWIQGFDSDGAPHPWAEKNRDWKKLNERFNPDGNADIASMLYGPGNPGVNTPQSRARAEHLDRVIADAIQRTDPGTKAATRLGKAWQEMSVGLSQMMLFNVLNVPRYMLQNLLGNSINASVRGGGPRVALKMFTNLKEWGRNYGNLRDPSHATTLDGLLKKTGMGDRPNMQMSPKQYFDRANKQAETIIGKAFQGVGKVIAPDWARYMASVPDQGIRGHVGAQALLDGYADLNKRLVPIVKEELRKRVPTRMPDEAHVQRIVSDFLKEEQTLIDPNTNLPHKNLLGKTSKFEPVWNADDVRIRLREQLTEGMTLKPDAGQLNRAINDITGILKEETRKIVDDADARVDYALFSWRNTVGDEWLSRGMLMHYWGSRQGGFYVSEGLRHSWAAAAYGRMMEEMKQQNEELGGPAWMTGWFQFMNSPAGMSVWFSPFDMIGSLLTMADWQKGEEQQAFQDLTELGKVFKAMPLFINPLLQAGAYELGLLGPDYPAPAITGTETFFARGTDLLNLANAEDAAFMKPFNALGVGVDANGNKVPIPPRSLQELYSRVGNAISTALMPLTGLPPVEVISSGAGMARNIQTIGEQQTRENYPQWNDGSVEGAIRISSHITDVMSDPGSAEYQDWYKRAAQAPFQAGDLPQPLGGLARIASPIGISSQPEQRRLDQMEGLEPSGNIPPRVLPEGDLGGDLNDFAKYGASKTPEGRALSEQDLEFKNLLPPELKAVRDTVNAISGGYLDEPITVGGRTWSNEELSELSRSDNYRVREQYALEQGYSLDEEVYATYDTEAEWKAEHPEYAAYDAYKGMIPYGEEQAFAEQMAATNPGFAQYLQSQMTDHVTGEVKWYLVKTPDAYLASQGIAPSVYSPLVGNEPSTIPGGAPSVPGVPPGQAIIPEVRAVTDMPLFGKPGDADQGYYDDPPLAVISPDMPIEVIDPRRGSEDGMVQVSIGEFTGYVDASLLEGMEPPAGAPTVVPAVAAPPTGGGLAGLAGGAINALGAAKDEVGAVVGSMVGGGGTPTKPAQTSSAVSPGYYDVVPANDGMGVQSTIAADRTWMEDMLGGIATVTTDYKGPPPAGVSYEYQNGHAADGTTHAAYDISCDTGSCWNTPLKSPVAGRVVCAGYGQGTGEALGSPQCTYSQNTTTFNDDGTDPAHTIVIEVGTDAQGNPIQLSFNHMGTSNLKPGDTVQVGDLIGGMGNGACSSGPCPHVHLEGWLGDPQMGYQIVDPTLIVDGYYSGGITPG
jgi:hypothetical protein